MKTSQAGIDLLKRWEGCKLTAYRDSAGVWTVGYGLTTAAGIIVVKEGTTITQRQAEAYLVEALAKYELAVEKALKRQPTQSQFDAMVSLCYNIGPGAFAGSTVVRRFNEGNIAGSADAFLMWTKAGGRELQGLVNRRKDERALFLKASPLATGGPQGAREPAQPIPPPVIADPPPAATPDGGKGIAGWVLAAAGALVAVLAAWIMKG